MDSHNLYSTNPQHGDSTAQPNFWLSNTEGEPHYANSGDIHRFSEPPYVGAPGTETYLNVHSNQFNVPMQDTHDSLYSAQRRREQERNLYGDHPPSTQIGQPMRSAQTTTDTSRGQPAQPLTPFPREQYDPWPMQGGHVPFQPISYSMSASGPGVCICYFVVASTLITFCLGQSTGCI
jgi:hypothetical protein